MKKLAVLVLTALSCATISFGGVIYSALGPGNTFGGAYTSVDGTSSFSEGVVFTAASSGNLTDVLVPVADDPTGVLTFNLYTDGGGQPGALLESWANMPVPVNITGPVTINSVAHPFLSAGSVYWFTATSGPVPASVCNGDRAPKCSVASGARPRASPGRRISRVPPPRRFSWTPLPNPERGF